MKNKVLFVVSMFVILAVFGLVGFVPENLTGSLVYFPEASTCTGSSCIDKAVEAKKASYADKDLTKFYDNYFEMKQSDKIIVDDRYMFKYIHSFAREWVSGSSNKPNYESDVSVERIVGGRFESSDFVRVVKKRDEVVGFDGLNFIMDWAYQGLENDRSDDRAQFIFPNTLNLVYYPGARLTTIFRDL